MTTEPDSYADVVERLFREFEPLHGLWTITQVVRRCRADLHGAPRASLPAALEELARERLAAVPVLNFPAVDQDGDEFTTLPVSRAG
ncbi:hypothetical protein [Pseudonocardia acaciae]|uniref:hypothetical protein n=1 Tax=Pseudonocardia acaciae TaxID=551276 RepID=UPI0006868FE8|nr:hypothetical protein [Pseudonocardia acaciae]